MGTRTVGWVPWTLAALAGCTSSGHDLRPSPAEILEGGPATAVEALGGVGAAPYRAVIRATNRFGASVEDEPVQVTVGGTTSHVAFDGFGYGGFPIDQAGTVEVQPSGGVSATVTVVASTWPGLGYDPAWVAPVPDADDLVAVTNGLVGRKGPELWWVGSGAPAHRIFAADEDLLGARAVNVDVDGVLDLVAWTSQEVYLLRGRGGGGFSWGTAFHATGMTVAGADVADLSDDNLPDVAIAWVASDGSGTLDVWEGDGLFQFQAAEPRDLSGRPTSLQIDDATGEGTPQVTVLLDDGAWDRFIRGAELQYIPIGPFFPSSILLPRDAGLVSVGDLNYDGGAELGVASARTEGEPRSLYVIDVAIDGVACSGGDASAQCLTSFAQLEPGTSFTTSHGDADGDTIDDLWVLGEDHVLGLYTYHGLDRGASAPRHAISTALPTYGPISTTDVDRDTLADLAVGGPSIWQVWLGQPSSDSDQLWRPRPVADTFVRDLVQPFFAPIETDGNPDTLEFATTDPESGQTMFKIVQYTRGGGRAPNLCARQIATSELVPTDLAVCGKDVYVAIGGQVVHLDATDPAHPDLDHVAGNGATRLDCGRGPSGSTVAVLENGSVVLRDRALANVGTAPANGAVNLELVDLGGATEEVRTCATDGCDVAAWTWAPNQRSVVVGDDTSLTVTEGAGQGTELGGSGRPMVLDLDGDGHDDLVAVTSAGIVTLHRSSGEGIGNAELFQGTIPFVGAVTFEDGDGDGWRDPFVVDGDANLVYTTLPKGDATTTPETGDTGDTGIPTAP